MRGRGASPFRRWGAGNFADVPARVATAALCCEGSCGYLRVGDFDAQRAAYAAALNSAGSIPPPRPPDGRSLQITLHRQIGPGLWRCTRCLGERDW